MREEEDKKISESELKEKSKKLSIIEGSFANLSEGFGTGYVTPYALAIGANNMIIGLLSSLPSLMGNLSQMFTFKLIEKYPRKKIVSVGALLQAIMWLLMLLAGLFFFVFRVNSIVPPLLLFLIYTILVSSGVIVNPIWNSWMKDLVQKDSGKYFGTRNRITGSVALVTMLIGGFILDYFKHTKIFFGFIILFSVSSISKLISVYFLTKKYEPEFKLQKGYYFTFWQFVKKAPKSNFGRFAIAVSFISFATAIASPFFSVYMLKDLNFTYTEWIITLVASSFSTLIFVALWGKFADRYGNLIVIKISGFLIPFIPILWIIFTKSITDHSHLLIVLIFVQIFSGIVWAGFNLTSSNFIYDAVTRERMALCVAYFNIFNSIGVFIGAILGGILSSMNISIIGLRFIPLVMLISGVLRMIVYLLMIPRIKEVREVDKFGIKEAKEKLMFINPKYMFKYFENFTIKSRQEG